MNFCSPNLTVLVTGPQQRMAELPVPRRGGQRAGADELWGSTEYAAPVSIRNFIPESLLIAWAKLAGDAEASELTAPGLFVSRPHAGGAIHAGVGLAAVPQMYIYSTPD